MDERGSVREPVLSNAVITTTAHFGRDLVPRNNKNIFVTGGAGYIGTHTAIELLNAGYDVTVFDNFSNSHPQGLRCVEKLTSKKIRLIKGDMRDELKLFKVLSSEKFDGVIHLAGLKAVGESSARPLDYYDNNIVGTLCLLRAMRQTNTKSLVFSSSATVYGEPQFLPLTEEHPLHAASPYGRTKLFIEEILRDLHRAEPQWAISILRYFNPVGAHESGLIGESPLGLPNNLMPLIARVATGRLEKLKIWGNDYNTADGTGVRDYIHVVDLARGHLKALEHLTMPQCREINLGTGRGVSVLEIVRAFENASGRKISYEFSNRRSGDVASYYADTSKAAVILDWHAIKSLEAMCADTWRWHFRNPKGYDEV